MNNPENKHETTRVSFPLKKAVNTKLKKVQATLFTQKSEEVTLHDLYNAAIEIGTSHLMKELNIAA